MTYITYSVIARGATFHDGQMDFVAYLLLLGGSHTGAIATSNYQLTIFNRQYVLLSNRSYSVVATLSTHHVII